MSKSPFDTLMEISMGFTLPRALHVVAELGVADARHSRRCVGSRAARPLRPRGVRAAGRQLHAFASLPARAFGSGTILEFPDIAAQAREHIVAAGLAARCDAVDGDARIAIPIGADAYIMKAVLCGRTDNDAEAILSNCRHAMREHAKLLIIERLLPEGIDPDDAIARANLLSDINMMVATDGGRERIEAEYRTLLLKAGLRFTRVIRAPGTSAIIEAEPG